MLLDVVETAVRDVQKIAGYLGPLMARHKTQQRVFGLILDRAQGETITPVTSKETAIALEILQKLSRLYAVNPHSKGFVVLNRLVVETALPQVQVPALRLLMTLLSSSDHCRKSFRKSRGVVTLGKWVKEHRGAAKLISARPMLDVFEMGSRLVAIVCEDDVDRKAMEEVFGVRELSELRAESNQKESPILTPLTATK